MTVTKDKKVVWIGPYVPDHIRNREVNSEWIGTEVTDPKMIPAGDKQDNYKTIRSIETGPNGRYLQNPPPVKKWTDNSNPITSLREKRKTQTDSTA